MNSDDRLQRGLDAYAEHLQRAASLAPAREIRRRAARRRRNRATAAAFAAVLVTAVGVGTVLIRDPGRLVTPTGPVTPGPATPGPASPGPLPPAPSSPPSAPPAAPSPTTVAPSATASRGGTATSNVSQLRQLGIDLETGVLIDVADDGADHWMQIGANDVVDFTGSARDASTEMSLRPAPVPARNTVVITPPARPGSCVADTPQDALILRPCRDGDPAQTWRVVPAGDSGQFELHGQYGVLTVDDRLVAADRSGRTGLQTIPFDR